MAELESRYVALRPDNAEHPSTEAEGESWVVIGDSFSDPNHSGYVEREIRAWTQLVADRQGITVHCFASSGDGYVHRKRVTFPEQAAEAASALFLDHSTVSHVIVYGGINDSSSEERIEDVKDAAADIATTLIDSFPCACIEGYMNWYPHDYDDVSKSYVAAIADGLASGGVALRTDSMWILENPHVADAYLPDNLHPNQHGHELMADFFIAACNGKAASKGQK